jgi:hypothetical protein
MTRSSKEMSRRQLGRFFCGALIASVAAAASPALAEIVESDAQAMGEGAVKIYSDFATDGTPNAIGVQMSRDALDGLPVAMNNESRCFDKNGNGAVDPEGECVGDYELSFPLPPALTESGKTPFGWITVNWNAMGHMPPAPPAWGAPHFDFHFYIQPEAEVRAIRAGPCAEFINCDDFATAQRPVPARYLNQDFLDVGAAVPAMGNHLVDTKSPELAPGGPPFTHTWIYGAYDGHVTFYEPMVTHDFLVNRPDICVPIKAPEAFEEAGYYPTEYCIRSLQEGAEDALAVSLEKFVWREAG